jgi:hypothetical protein
MSRSAPSNSLEHTGKQIDVRYRDEIFYATVSAMTNFTS